MGAIVGGPVRLADGDNEGQRVGDAVGGTEGLTVGPQLGRIEGVPLGTAVGHSNNNKKQQRTQHILKYGSGSSICVLTCWFLSGEI